MAAGLDVVEPTAKVVTKTELSGDPVKLRSSSVNCFGKKWYYLAYFNSFVAEKRNVLGFFSICLTKLRLFFRLMQKKVKIALVWYSPVMLHGIKKNVI